MKRRDNRARRAPRPWAAVAFAILLLPFSLYAQIVGTVSDSSGLGIAGAEIVLSCPNETWIGSTDFRGRFRSSDSKSRTGDCTITVNQKGFEPFERHVRPGDNVIAVQLKIATVRQIVRVEERLGEESLVRTTISSISLSDAELTKISNDTADLIRYAKLLAGAMARDDIIQVDGLPSHTLPPAEMISRIVVNANPFSAQYGQGNANFIDIVTKAPDRKLRFSLGGSPPGAGGGDGIMPGLRSDSKSVNFRISGPLLQLPLTFSARTSFSNSVNNVPLVAAVPSIIETASEKISNVRSTSRNGSAAFDIYYSRESLQGSISYSETRGVGSNQGAGGLTLPAAGFKTSSIVRSTRMSVNHTGRRFLVRSGLAAGQRAFDLRANSEGLGISVAGAFVTGGAPVTRNKSDRTEWNWTTIVQPNSQRPSWMLGLPVTRSTGRDDKVPNSAGVLQFESVQAYIDALSNGNTGTWFLTSGNGSVAHGMSTVSPFVQGTLKNSAHLLINGGLRFDYQSGFGTRVSPRLTIAAERKGVVLRTGAGLFVRNVPQEIFMKVLSAAPGHLLQFVTPNISLTDSMRPAGSDIALHSSLAADLAPMREIMVKSSIERPLRNWNPGLEYTWSRDRHLLGSQRTQTDHGWLDVLGSASSAEKHELHLRLGHTWKRQTVTGHYNWIRSRDNSDGPFFFPEQQDNLRAEWARTTGISPHNVTLVGNFSLPAAVALAVTYSYRNSAPYNITTGLDVTHTALYNDRGGRSRNSGDGPGQNLLSLYFSRRLDVPMSHGRNHVNIGVQADNVLAAKNYIGVGSVVGSPMYGKPVAAYPGPSVRLWFNVD